MQVTESDFMATLMSKVSAFNGNCNRKKDARYVDNVVSGEWNLFTL